jgi:hypothetical protein
MYALEQDLKARAERHIERDIGCEYVPVSASTSTDKTEKDAASPGALPNGDSEKKDNAVP